MSNGSHRCEMKYNKDTREDLKKRKQKKLPNVKESVFVAWVFLCF